MKHRDINVYIIDDDSSVRKGLARLLKSMGIKTFVFETAIDFLGSQIVSDTPCCIILDVKMPFMTGMELQAKLSEGDYCMPIIFITGHGDIPMGVTAMKKGAVDFLKKPFEEKDLLAAIDVAVQKDKVNRAAIATRDNAKALISKLTERELEIFRYIITGMLNKQIAYELDISEKTVKAHRGHITTKLDIFSVAELVRLANDAEVEPAVSSR